MYDHKGAASFSADRKTAPLRHLTMMAQKTTAANRLQKTRNDDDGKRPSGEDGVGESSVVMISICAWLHRACTIPEAKRQTTRRIAWATKSSSSSILSPIRCQQVTVRLPSPFASWSISSVYSPFRISLFVFGWSEDICAEFSSMPSPLKVHVAIGASCSSAATTSPMLSSSTVTVGVALDMFCACISS